MRMMKMTGASKINFEDIYDTQVMFQEEVKKTAPYEFEVGTLPEDNIKGFSFHMQQLMSEIGEVLDADKRWKNYRNSKYDKENKLEELADCFIVLINVCIFSGFKSSDIISAIVRKIHKNTERIKNLK